MQIAREIKNAEVDLVNNLLGLLSPVISALKDLFEELKTILKE